LCQDGAVVMDKLVLTRRNRPCMKSPFSLKKFQRGYTARALGHSIFTEADSWEELKVVAQAAVRCLFDAADLAATLFARWVLGSSAEKVQHR
jgi:hypothetical protein